MKLFNARQSRGKKLKAEEEEDRLSSLPDALLIDILSRRLSIKTVVLTSVLSHRWRYLWTGITSIPPVNPTVIDHILPQLTSPKLQDFFLRIAHLPSSEYPKTSTLHSWFRQVYTRNVEKIYVTAGIFDIPPFMFNSHSLVILSLYGELTFENEATTMSFQLPNLKKLTLDYFTQIPPWLDTLIQSSPLLESLRLFFGLVHRNKNSVYIIAPNLKSLTIRLYCDIKIPHTMIYINAPQLVNIDICDCTSVYYYFLQKSTMLVKATIDLTDRRHFWGVQGGGNNEYYRQEMSKFIGGLSSVTTLDLMVRSHSNVFPYLNFAKYANVPMFSNLVSLETNCLRDLMLSLHSFPSLENLVVNLYLQYEDDPPMEQSVWQPPDSIPHCLVSSLKTIRILALQPLQGIDDDLSLLAYILTSATVLKMLFIRVSLNNDGYDSSEQENAYALGKELQFCRSLLKFPRSSSACEVVVSREY